jgi:hypothetical protein
VSSSRGSRFAVLGLALVAIAAAMILGAFRRNARP